MGVVEVFFGTPEENDSLTDPNLLKAISERLGRIIERFQAEEKLVELATTDPLTGLYNRRHFFEPANIEIERAQRYNHPLSCMMFDVDYFKNINDTQGHRFGDRVLQEMVKRCRVNIRRVDIFARYGGDEFVILLPETGLQRATKLAKRLRDEFQEQKLQTEGKNTLITLSVGVATMNGDSDLKLDTLLVRADQALYKSKGKGRNQVSIWANGEQTKSKGN
jgi:two-component system cell cycle response regulator